MGKTILFLLLSGLPLVAQQLAPPTGTAFDDQMKRGKRVYAQSCFLCHQPNGLGTPGTFPPLAKADYLMSDRERSIRVLINGLTNRIIVNGRVYQGVMPPSGLNDDQISDVLTYVRNSWGNTDRAITVEEVQKVRGRKKKEVKEEPYFPLPKSPPGTQLREVLRMPWNPVRMLPSPDGKLIYVLGGGGDVSTLHPGTGELLPIIKAEDYVNFDRGDANCVGFAHDTNKNQFYFVVNQRNESGKVVTNELTIFRTTTVTGGHPSNPKAWLKAGYPWGIGPYNHGLGHAAFGPDGFLYVNSGSRTDGNEKGTNPKYGTEGEHHLTACMWRLDPKSENPEIEIFARGLRNTYGFCWNDKGEMFGTDNGPDADAPEELNRIEKGKHYGFPFEYSDWQKRKAYPYTPDGPAGTTFTQPVANKGPAAGFDAKPIFTFDAHSSPAGICYLDQTFPAPYAGSFVLVRFGNLLPKPKDTGFDLLRVKINSDKSDRLEAEVHTILEPIGRPIDVIPMGGKVYIAEYGRGVRFKGDYSSMMPGRILELSFEK